MCFNYVIYGVIGPVEFRERVGRVERPGCGAAVPAALAVAARRGDGLAVNVLTGIQWSPR